VAPLGRFAPSPTGDLHLGNLRTALVAWASATAGGGSLLVRMEDLDPATSSRRHEQRQLADLLALGIEHRGEVVRQSERFERYRAAIAELDGMGLVYPCWCTRREIREAAAAPNAPDAGLPEGAYPGTCRDLGPAARAARERSGRRPALRLRASEEVAGEATGDEVVVHDLVAGRVTGRVDDVVLQRADGVPAYNLAVVVDDHLQGVTEVVRGDDLLPSTPRQVHLQRLLGLRTPAYAHVPLVLGPDGRRLAKRHGAVTLEGLAAAGIEPAAVRSLLAASLGLCAPGEAVTAADVASRLVLPRLPREPWRLDPATLPAAVSATMPR